MRKNVQSCKVPVKAYPQFTIKKSVWLNGHSKIKSTLWQLNITEKRQLLNGKRSF